MLLLLEVAVGDGGLRALAVGEGGLRAFEELPKVPPPPATEVLGDGGLGALPMLPPRPPPVVVGEGGLGVEPICPTSPAPEVVVVVGEGGLEGALAAATGEVFRFCLPLGATVSPPTLGDGFLLEAVPPPGDR